MKPARDKTKCCIVRLKFLTQLQLPIYCCYFYKKQEKDLNTNQNKLGLSLYKDNHNQILK